MLFTATLHGQQAAADCAADGSVTDAVTGEPIPRARVTLNNSAGQRATLTDNAGHFFFTGAACGRSQFMATRPGFLPGGDGAPRPGVTFSPSS